MNTPMNETPRWASIASYVLLIAVFPLGGLAVYKLVTMTGLPDLALGLLFFLAATISYKSEGLLKDRYPGLES